MVVTDFFVAQIQLDSIINSPPIYSKAVIVRTHVLIHTYVYTYIHIHTHPQTLTTHKHPTQHKN